MGNTKTHFFNRELSWLEFNQRVLTEAGDRSVPLLERLSFLGITASNLDEFFMVRVSGLQILSGEGILKTDPSGLPPAQQLDLVYRRARQMVDAQYACFLGAVEPDLRPQGFVRLAPRDFSPAQAEHLAQFFEKTVFPVLTPSGLHPRGDFPLLANLGLNMAIRLKHPGRAGPRFAVIPLGGSLDRFVPVPSDERYAYALLEDILAHFVQRYFPSEQIAETVVFRITRNADLALQEDVAPDLLAEMETVLSRRRSGDCVRLEISAQASRLMVAFLRKAIGVPERDIYRVPGPLDLSAFRRLAALPGFEELHFPPWPPQDLPGLDRRRSIFTELSQKSLLLSHPFDSFEPVVRLLEEAASDPAVLAIKQTLYRTSSNSPIVAALRRAAERGKHVTAIVELKARFDEAQNIEWARRLEETGAQVIYGVRGLKTHAKVCIVVRREAAGLARYMHFGTGNYNEKTARVYTDVGYMTRDEDLASDASSFFNAICGVSEPLGFHKLEAAPIGLRNKLLELIESEIDRQRQGQKGQVMAKLNSLVDPALIECLYRASQAGVEILLNVRGICCLRPGVRRLSENIRVISIVDRFLEHSRIFYFHRGGDPRVYLSSADWMPRNLDRRVELMVPVEDPACARKLIGILRACFADTAKAWQLGPEGSYTRVAPPAGRRALRCQEALYREACALRREARHSRRTLFEPHRPAGAKS
jgi:polyphosphate kinase